jgi:dTDP-4-dehydrorhamnose reductase
MPKTKKTTKYLVIGGHGKLGRELCHLIDCVTPSHQELDILSFKQTEFFIADKNIDAVIHLAAITSRAQSERNKALTYATNVIGTANIARVAHKHSKKIIYVSTERVFNGIDGNYKENTRPDPPDWYGYTKLAAEYEIKNITKNYLIIRMSFRPKRWDFPTAFTDVITTADYVDVMAKEMALALSYNISGVIHLGTPKKTVFELAKKKNPKVKPEECPDSAYTRRLDLCLDKWASIKAKYNER